MAKKISELPLAGGANGTDLIPATQGATTRAITVNQIRSSIDFLNLNYSGLTSGHILIATGATTAAFLPVGNIETSLDLANMGGTLGINHGGTGATTAATARTNLGVAAALHQDEHQVGGTDELAGDINANARVMIRVDSGADVGPRRRINFLQGTNVSIIATDVGGSEEVTVQISAPTAAHAASHYSGGSDPLTGNLDAIARTTVRVSSGANVGSRRRINFIEGTNVTITALDDNAGEEIDLTINSSVGLHASTHYAGGSDELSGNLNAVARTTVRLNSGADVGSRRRINFISAGNISLSASDDNAGEEIDLTITGTTHAASHYAGGSDELSGNLNANARTTVRVNSGANIGSRRRINFISAGNISISASDDNAGEEIDLTIDGIAHASTHYAGGSDELTGNLNANARVAVRKNSTGATIGTRRRINFIEGANTTITISDDGTDEEVDVTIATSAFTYAPADAQYLTLAANGTLTVERVFTPDTNVFSVTDGGAGASYSFGLKGANARMIYRSDFVESSLVGLTENSAGTASSFAFGAPDAAGRPGQAVLTAGTTITGRAALNGGTASIILGGGVFTFETYVNLSNLSDGTVTYVTRIGLGDSNTATEHTDGVFFRYTHTESANWVLVCKNNNTETTANSSTAVAAATWVKLSFTVNAAGTSVTFYINGTSVGTITTNIPTGAGRGCGFAWGIFKSAGSGGGSQRTLTIDYYEANYYLTSAR